ncbi:hypothetical protein [Bacillus cereus group sp. BfR-BA-01347]|uniref:hypothetical protein n=1 Tax=Bacillus cereus group sp. BfR-BA-01347 TaxID=2920310 RepID=UPI001F55FA40|nr:hypothetical protein [Bacillus cereus group sp. BfR-BA-01347]
MSFVSVVGRSDFLSVMTDGRVTDGEKILQEDYPKYRMIGENIIVAFTGDRAACEWIFYVLNQEVVMKQDFMITARDIKELLNHHPKLKGCDVRWIIGGINPQNEIECITISTEEKEPIRHEVPSEKVLAVYAYAFDADQKELGEKFAEFIKQEGELASAQQLLNDYVADKDFTVNKNTYHVLIRK